MLGNGHELLGKSMRYKVMKRNCCDSTDRITIKLVRRRWIPHRFVGRTLVMAIGSAVTSSDPFGISFRKVLMARSHPP